MAASTGCRSAQDLRAPLVRLARPQLRKMSPATAVLHAMDAPTLKARGRLEYQMPPLEEAAVLLQGAPVALALSVGKPLG